MKTYTIEIKWALIFSAMFLLWMLMERLAGLHDKYLERQQVVTMLVLIPSLVIYILAMLDKKKHHYSGNMPYKQSFMSGLMLSVFVVILSPVNQLITSYLISPDYFANAIEHTVKAGMFTRQQAEAQFTMKSFILTSIAGGLVTGTIFSAVISIFIRSKTKL